jgi:formate/nitrite transporter FocA (FNT family)
MKDKKIIKLIGISLFSNLIGIILFFYVYY